MPVDFILLRLGECGTTYKHCPVIRNDHAMLLRFRTSVESSRARSFPKTYYLLVGL